MVIRDAPFSGPSVPKLRQVWDGERGRRRGEGEEREGRASRSAEAWLPLSPPTAHVSQESSRFRKHVLSTYSVYSIVPTRGDQNRIPHS